MKTATLIVSAADLKIDVERSTLQLANYPEVEIESISDFEISNILAYGVKAYEVRDREDDIVATVMVTEYDEVLLYSDEVDALEEYLKGRVN